MDWSFAAVILQLIFLECVLSIDNAAILGAMVQPLPDDQPAPWPRALQGLGKRLQPILGNQRTAVLRVGLFGAYVGRGAMLLLASLIIHNPWLKLIGAAYLVRLAFDNLSAAKFDEEDDLTQPVKTTSFWMTVVTVNLMDMVFSLDNVVAAVSLSDKLWVVMLGVAIGILAMRFAAGIFTVIIEKEPILKNAAYILVFAIGVELLLDDLAHIEISDWTRFGISIAIILMTLAYAKFRPLRFVFRPILLWFSQGFSILNSLVDWVIVPFKALVGVIWNGIQRLLPAKSEG